MNPWQLFAIPSLIWGSTFYAITLQLGTVPAAVSVAYRFALASLLMLAWCAVRGLRLRFPPVEHLWFAAQGACSFGIGYVLVYLAEERVTSGLVAMVFALMVFLNPALARVAFGTPVTGRLAGGAVLGVAGTVLLFWRDAVGVGFSYAGLAMSLVAMVLSVLGNLVAQRNHSAGVPTGSGIGWGMLYGALGVGTYALIAGLPWRFDPSLPYVGSLLYLAVIGSVVAFATYFRLIEKLGPGPAAYVSVVCPVIAISLSTVLEGYRWSVTAAGGVAMIVAGMALTLAPQRPGFVRAVAAPVPAGAPRRR